jgi:hypothetical protein
LITRRPRHAENQFGDSNASRAAEPVKSDRLLGADFMSPIHKVTFQRLDSPLDVVANRTRRNLRLKRILPPTGPFAGAEEQRVLTRIMTEGRRNQQQRGQGEEKKAFHDILHMLSAFSQITSDLAADGGLGMEPMRNRPVRAYS